MKNITDYINESLIIEATKGTVKDYVLWHYGLDDEKDFTYDTFASREFDEKALKKYFNGDKQQMYNEIVDLMKNDKKININSTRSGNRILTKFKAGKYTMNAFSDSEFKWAPEREFAEIRTVSDKTQLTYDNQLTFKSWALTKMNKEGVLDKIVDKKSWKFREYGLFSFDSVHGYDTMSDNGKGIKGLIADGSLTFGDAYDVVVNYFKQNSYK